MNKNIFVVLSIISIIFLFCINAIASELNYFYGVPFGDSYADDFVSVLIDNGIPAYTDGDYTVVLENECTSDFFPYPLIYLRGDFDPTLSFIEFELGLDDDISNEVYIDAFETITNCLNNMYGKFNYRLMSIDNQGVIFPYDHDTEQIKYDVVEEYTHNSTDFELSLYWKNIHFEMGKVDGIYINPILKYQSRRYVFDTSSAKKTGDSERNSIYG